MAGKKYGGGGGYGDKPPGGQYGKQDVVAIILKRYTAIDLFNGLIIALGIVPIGKKKGKGKKDGGGGYPYGNKPPGGSKPPGGRKPPAGGKPPGGGKRPGGGKPPSGRKKRPR
ncbi:MAG: hypothetical protein L0Y67_00055 [Gammaproteobacteria bacterium]|nr:hypothetical protein [Gammaproteobacteria bacterium]